MRKWVSQKNWKKITRYRKTIKYKIDGIKPPNPNRFGGFLLHILLILVKNMLF